MNEIEKRLRNALENEGITQLRAEKLPVNESTVKAVLIGFRIAQRIVLESFDEMAREFGFNSLVEAAMIKKRIKNGLREFSVQGE